jgi:hypothetical protein
LLVATRFDGALLLAAGEEAFFTAGDLDFPDLEAAASVFFDTTFFAAGAGSVLETLDLTVATFFVAVFFVCSTISSPH